MSDKKKIIFEAPAELVDRLAAAAEERAMSRNFLTARLLDEALDALLPTAQIRLTTLHREPTWTPLGPLGPTIKGPGTNDEPAASVGQEGTTKP